jgi:hypothetical protein
MEGPLSPEPGRRQRLAGWIALNARAFTMPFHQPRLSLSFLTLHVRIGAKPQALLKTDDRTISAFRSLPSLSIDAFPHGMMSAHEMDAMAAIFGANVDVDRPRFDVAWPLARLAGKAASATKGRSNRENRSARNPMQRRCVDRPASPSDPLRQFRGPVPPGASWASANRRPSSKPTSAAFTSS